MCDRLAILVGDEPEAWVCSVTAIDGGEPSPADIAEFTVEANDHTLRERIRNETAPMRNVILALAFSQVDLNHNDAP
jgi:His-Xaa-Ser system protein HxsD